VEHQPDSNGEKRNPLFGLEEKNFANSNDTQKIKPQASETKSALVQETITIEDEDDDNDLIILWDCNEKLNAPKKNHNSTSKSLKSRTKQSLFLGKRSASTILDKNFVKKTIQNNSIIKESKVKISHQRSKLRTLTSPWGPHEGYI